MMTEQTERLLEAMRTAAIFLDELDDVRAENLADYLRTEIREARTAPKQRFIFRYLHPPPSTRWWPTEHEAWEWAVSSLWPEHISDRDEAEAFVRKYGEIIEVP